MRAHFSRRTRRSLPIGTARQGSFAPAAILALVVVVSGVALVLDKLWLEAAHAELTTAVEAAALSSGKQLASDDLLREDSAIESRLERARVQATELAARHLIAGQPVQLDASEEGSIRFGKLVLRNDADEPLFVETTDNPTSVVVTGARTRSGNNPVALLWQGIAGIDFADVVARAEATVDNHVVGFRALNGIPIPALPLAILKRDLSQKHPDWETQIESRLGQDLWRYDAVTHQPVEEKDGIPEIVLKTVAPNGKPEDANVQIFALDRTTNFTELDEHLKLGWNIADFHESEPELRLDRGPQEFLRIDPNGGNVATALEKLIGECRIVLLYDQLHDGNVRCVGAVAGRILQLTRGENGVCQMVFQPGVLTTRTAILPQETLVPLTHELAANRYIYKLQLTY